MSSKYIINESHQLFLDFVAEGPRCARHSHSEWRANGILMASRQGISGDLVWLRFEKSAHLIFKPALRTKNGRGQHPKSLILKIIPL